MNSKSIITFVLITVGILVGVTALLWNFGGQQGQPIEGVAGEAIHARGEGAVEVVEFSDLQCPACRSVHEPLKQLLSQYEGKVKFVYRHFPLTSIHKNAMAAAYATEAAYEQNKFWEMQDLLFERQGEWEGLADPKDKFVEYATELSLDPAQFVAAMEGEGAKSRVSKDLVDSTRFRLSGTPTFFVNGVETEFNLLSSKIDEALK